MKKSLLNKILLSCVIIFGLGFLSQAFSFDNVTVTEAASVKKADKTKEVKPLVKKINSNQKKLDSKYKKVTKSKDEVLSEIKRLKKKYPLSVIILAELEEEVTDNYNTVLKLKATLDALKKSTPIFEKRKNITGLKSILSAQENFGKGLDLATKSLDFVSGQLKKIGKK